MLPYVVMKWQWLGAVGADSISARGGWRLREILRASNARPYRCGLHKSLGFL